MPSDGDLTVRLLSDPAHYVDRAGVHRSGRALALIAFLLLERPEGATRDELMELLWEPAPGVDVTGRFRNFLYELRQTLPPGILQEAGRNISVNRSRLDLDIDRLRMAMANDQPSTVVEVYQCGFLHGCAPSASREFEEWVDRTRGALHESVSEFLHLQADRLHSEPGLYARIAQKLIHLNDYDETAWAHLVRACILSRDAAGALAAADRLTALNDGAVAGVGDTEELVERARSLAREGRAEFGTLPIGFVGRQKEMTEIQRHLWPLQDNRGSCIAIVGPSGIGKSRLLHEIHRTVTVPRIQVVRARAYEVESRSPYALISEILKPLATEARLQTLDEHSMAQLGRMFSASESFIATGLTATSVRSVESERVALQSAAITLIMRAAHERPLLILVDDAHWSDHHSLRVLHRLMLTTGRAPVVVILAYRDSHEWMMMPLLAPVRASHIRLAPFDGEEIRRMLLEMGDFNRSDVRENVITALLATSGGIPLQLVQQLALLQSEGQLVLHDGAWHVSELGGRNDSRWFPGPIASLISLRLAQLTDAQLSILAALSIIDRPAGIAEVADLSGRQSNWQDAELLHEWRLLDFEAGDLVIAHAEIGAAARRAIAGTRVQEMFAYAYRRTVTRPGDVGTGASDLARLRLACGAGLRYEARLEFLSMLRLLGDPGMIDQEGERILAMVEAWAASPGLYATLFEDWEIFRRHPYEVERRARRHARRNRIHAAFRRRSIRLVAALVIIDLTAVLTLRPVDSEPTAAAKFGGGGTLILTSEDGRTRALQITGPTLGDTVQSEEFLLPNPAVRNIILSPDRTRMLYRCEPDGGGPPEVCLAQVDGSGAEVVAPSSGDDLPLGWSPDGRQILIQSDRSWSGSYNYDVHAVILETEETRNLSRDDYISFGLWSPDGTRVAFTGNGPDVDSLWVSTADGVRMRGFGFPGPIGSPAWSPDGRHIAITHGEERHHGIKVVSTVTGRVVWYRDGLWSTRPVWSPDGRVLAVGTPELAADVGASTLVHVFDAGFPDIGLPPGQRVVEWVPDRQPPYVEQLVATGATYLHPGEPGRLRILALDQYGDTLATPVLSFVADPENVVDVGPGDTLLGRRVGRSRIHVSAGGWRSAYTFLDVAERSDAVLRFSEDWTEGIDLSRWQPYGDPIPSVVATGEGMRAMRNNGDNLYPSGLVTVPVFSLRSGLSLEWRQRTPLTDDFWQEVWINLVHAPLEAFSTGPGEPFDGRTTIINVNTPILLDQPPRPVVAAFNSTLPYDSVFSRNDWHRVRLQVYPTGATDLFVDGKRILRQLPTIEVKLPDSIRVAIGGRTHGTDILIGQIRIFEGIVDPIR